MNPHPEIINVSRLGTTSPKSVGMLFKYGLSDTSKCRKLHRTSSWDELNKLGVDAHNIAIIVSCAVASSELVGHEPIHVLERRRADPSKPVKLFSRSDRQRAAGEPKAMAATTAGRQPEVSPRPSSANQSFIVDFVGLSKSPSRKWACRISSR